MKRALIKRKKKQGNKSGNKHNYLEYIFDAGNDMFVYSVLNKDGNFYHSNTINKKRKIKKNN